jgi:predicted GNAT superfamily acetyltransferase
VPGPRTFPDRASRFTIHGSRLTTPALITLRDLHSPKDYTDCVALQEETWGAGFSERVPTAILRVGQKIGGVSAGAFDENGRMVGFVFGLTGMRNNELVHWSDMLAVREELRGQGIGEKLKQYQRDKVLGVGVKSMLWTFDPMQAGNAHFNINHLGAMPIEYVPDMYGTHPDNVLFGAEPTDRFIVRWVLDAPVKPAANAEGIQVEIPADMAAVRREGHEAAMRWRLAVRARMMGLLSSGHRVVAFRRPADASPYYVLRRYNE